MKFLYMDERYADQSLPREAWSVTLTGMLVPADRHREIRDRFYDALATAVGRKPNTVPALIEIHAAALLPDADDNTRITFLQNVTDIITDFDLSLYRVGYRRTRQLVRTFKTDTAILGLAFFGLLGLVTRDLPTDLIWPVMETDVTAAQDQAFAGQVQFTDHIGAHIGTEDLSRDQTNLGEVLYSTKRSIHGALVDCAAYLLNVRTLAREERPLSAFKRRLADVADRLEAAVRYDEIILMRHGGPPTEPAETD